MKKLDTQVLQKLRGRLEEMPPRQHLRPYDVIAELAEPISGVRSRGYDLDDLVTVLSDVGIKLTRNTVRNYLSRARAAHRAAPSAGTSPATRPTPVAPAEAGTSSTAPTTETPAATAPVGSAAPTIEARNLAHRALERARERRESRERDDSRPPGSFKLEPDTDL